MSSRKTPARSIDVARLAGVSRSAVSRAFTEGAYVSQDTRDKVLKAAALLDYSPNVIARSLSKQRTRIVGIVTTDLRNRYYAYLLEELSRRLQVEGYATLLIVTDRADTDEGIARLLSYQVDAVILAAVMLSSTMTARCQQWGKPVVLVDRHMESDSITSVSGDNIAGAAAVADLLLDGGHERIAFIAGYEDTSTSRDRERGFRERLAARGHLLYARESGDYSLKGGTTAMRRLLSMPRPPDAVFCANDRMAIAALDAVREQSALRVPEDIVVVGYDNTPEAASPAYSLTSVDQNIPGIAEMAVRAVIDRLADPSAPVEHQWVPVSLIVRDSTRPLPQPT